jgi:hypothetical protein
MYEKELTYVLFPLNVAGKNTLKLERRKLELKVGAVHFALPVPEDGWPSRISKKEDLALVQAQITQEGPGVLWTGQRWEVGRFERDETTRSTRFVASKLQPHIIGGEAIEEEQVIEIQEEVTGKEYGSVIGLLKPRERAEWLLGS